MSDDYTPAEKALIAQGFYFYREHFRWGATPAYHTDDLKHFRFVDRGETLTPSQLLARLQRDWQPQRSADVDYFERDMVRELTQLPE